MANDSVSKYPSMRLPDPPVALPPPHSVHFQNTSKTNGKSIIFRFTLKTLQKPIQNDTFSEVYQNSAKAVQNHTISVHSQNTTKPNAQSRIFSNLSIHNKNSEKSFIFGAFAKHCKNLCKITHFQWSLKHCKKVATSHNLDAVSLSLDITNECNITSSKTISRKGVPTRPAATIVPPLKGGF